MSTQLTPYGFPYPESTDPVRDGATNIGNLAAACRAPELFSGQPCLAGTLPAGQNFKVRMIVYNYGPATDQFGLVAIPLPFTQVCVTAMIMPRNFRQTNVVSVALAQEVCTITSLGAYIRDAAGQGVPNNNVELAIIAWGY